MTPCKPSRYLKGNLHDYYHISTLFVRVRIHPWPFLCVFGKVLEIRLNAYGPLYVEKQPEYWVNLAESFIKARDATTGAPMF